MVESLSTCFPCSCPRWSRWSTAVTFSTTTGAGQGAEAAIRVPAAVQLGLQPRHSPFVGAVGQLPPRAEWCLRHRAELLRAASRGHTSMPHTSGLWGPLQRAWKGRSPGGKIPAKAGHTLSQRHETLEIGSWEKGLRFQPQPLRRTSTKSDRVDAVTHTEV